MINHQSRCRMFDIDLERKQATKDSCHSGKRKGLENNPGHHPLSCGLLTTRWSPGYHFVRHVHFAEPGKARSGRVMKAPYKRAL